MDEQIRRAEKWRDQSGAFLVHALMVSIALAWIPFIWALAHYQGYPTYEYRDVKVISRLGQNEWFMEKDDGQFMWNGCPDFPNSAIIWPGYIMKKFRYEDRGKCKSILRADLGVWWYRRENGDVIKIGESR
jgi:hypothetical protein